MRARCRDNETVALKPLRSVQRISRERLPSEIGGVLATKLLLRAVVAKTNFESEWLAFYKRLGRLFRSHRRPG